MIFIGRDKGVSEQVDLVKCEKADCNFTTVSTPIGLDISKIACHKCGHVSRPDKVENGSLR
jgi:hypothetical protein